MSFPNTQFILDDFGRADGALGANWVNALGSSGLTINARRAAGGPGASAWALPVGSGTAVYCRLAQAPSVTYVRLSLSSDLAGTKRYSVTWDSANLVVTGDSGSASNAAPILPGDWFGLSYDYTNVRAWMFAGVGPWTQVAFTPASAATQGWSAILEIDDVAAKVYSFSAETLPGSTPTLTAPIVHGRGAC